jgi:predicted nucleotidyltransferase
MSDEQSPARGARRPIIGFAYMSTRSPNVANSITALLATASPEAVASVYLFGSVAEGRAHSESDVDLAVLLRLALAPSARDRFEEGLRLQALLGAAAGDTRLDLVILNDAPPGFAARVVTTGQRLYCRDAEADHAFRRDAQLRAADLEPFLRRTRAIKLETLAR